ncbi:MAG: hypothetical protein P4L99_02675 [Chthoniobacter sp.]|nr:hypothetical protein [Chthoniobacter sp.]
MFVTKEKQFDHKRLYEVGQCVAERPRRMRMRKLLWRDEWHLVSHRAVSVFSPWFVRLRVVSQSAYVMTKNLNRVIDINYYPVEQVGPPYDTRSLLSCC